MMSRANPVSRESSVQVLSPGGHDVPARLGFVNRLLEERPAEGQQRDNQRDGGDPSPVSVENPQVVTEFEALWLLFSSVQFHETFAVLPIAVIRPQVSLKSNPARMNRR